MSTLVLLQAAAGQGSALTQMIIPFGMMFLIFWFLILRPQKKEQEAHQKFLGGLKSGDEVITASGIVGRVTAVEEKLVTLEIARGTKIQILKAQIQGSRDALLKDASSKDSAKDVKKLSKGKDDEIEEAVIEEASEAKSESKKKAW